jgi:anaerobic dimethyl sulfoxide reductase subunit C (anchor subunit)
MSLRKAPSGKRFHELPLVLFTALAVVAAGIGASRIVLSLAGVGEWLPTREQAAAVAGLMALGIAFSTLHLGRPFRAGLAVRGMGRSPLSNEVLVAGTTVLAAGLVVFEPQGDALTSSAGALVPVLSVGVLVTLGLVYRLSGQPAWRGLVVLGPLLLGLIFGVAMQTAWGAWGGSPPLPDVLVVAFLLDLLLTVARGVSLEEARRLGRAAYPGIFHRRAAILGGRVLLVDLLPPLGFFLGWGLPAVTVLLAGVVLDRFAFYGLAVERTTEAEVGRVEAVIRGEE